MSNTEKAPGKLASAAGGAITAYILAKTIKSVNAERKAQKARSATEVLPMPKAPEPEPKVLTPDQRAEFGEAKSRLGNVKSHLAQYMNYPASARKLLPRDGVYHSTWAYHRAPSYGSLHLDQSEYSSPEKEHRYNSGMEHLVALGKKPLRQAIVRSMGQDPAADWRSILTSDDFTRSPEHVDDAASANRETERIVGIWAAVEGMGFDTEDLAFAQWQDQEARYALVPYDENNPLHETVVSSAHATIKNAADPGLLIRYKAGRPEDISVAIRAVDIGVLRAEMGSEAIPPTPDPAALANVNYRGMGVLPSTPIRF
jgi:hypothetical protein